MKRNSPLPRHAGARWLLLVFLGGWCANGALAGGGPQNVVLVVNANSADSKTIANHYQQLRNIPASNVISLDYKGPLEMGNGRILREDILTPLLKAIDERKLSRQVDYLVYSADLPWRFDYNREYPAEVTFQPHVRKMASLTGASYLYQHTLAQSPSLLDLNTNWYVPGDAQQDAAACVAQPAPASKAFRGRCAWRNGAQRLDDPRQGQRYMLSTMLGVTQGRGNSVGEVLAYLKSAALADATPPQGRFIYMQNNDVRSPPRHACYAGAVAELKKLGAAAEVKQGVLPTGAQDVLGLTTGYADLGLGSANVRFAPGAIGDNLTSLGGVLIPNAGQTPLSEFLRLGAAGASGTVIEPFAIQAKFPLPWIHVHYRRGCSLGEAFYQSVRAPAILLIVGDPLCQPWAKRPQVKLTGVQPRARITGKLKFTVEATPPPTPANPAELYFDGKFLAALAPNQPCELDSAQMPDGYHELRVVVSTADALESQGAAIVPVFFSNHQQAAKLSVLPAVAGGPLVVRAEITGAKQISIRHNEREVASITSAKGEATIDPSLLGSGPVQLQAVGTPNEVRSAPALVAITK